MNTEYLFLYGSLMGPVGDRKIDRILMRARRSAVPAYIHGRLYDLGAYPAAVPATAGNGRVHGILVRLQTPRWLRWLDDYEGYIPCNPHHSEFVRTVASTWSRNGATPVRAWVYFYNNAVNGRRRIDSGRYRPRQ